VSNGGSNTARPPAYLCPAQGASPVEITSSSPARAAPPRRCVSARGVREWTWPRRTENPNGPGLLIDPEATPGHKSTGAPLGLVPDQARTCCGTCLRPDDRCSTSPPAAVKNAAADRASARKDAGFKPSALTKVAAQPAICTRPCEDKEVEQTAEQHAAAEPGLLPWFVRPVTSVYCGLSTVDWPSGAGRRAGSCVKARTRGPGYVRQESRRALRAAVRFPSPSWSALRPHWCGRRRVTGAQALPDIGWLGGAHSRPTAGSGLQQTIGISAGIAA
jgi:hypothetical protein